MTWADPVDEASRRLRLSGRSYLGVRKSRSSGSSARWTTADFDHNFEPRPALRAAGSPASVGRLPDWDIPAIDVFEVGGAYFIEDGRRHVPRAQTATHRCRGHASPVQLRIITDIDVSQLVHTEQQQLLLEEERTRSGATRRADRVRAARRFLHATSDIVEAHGYDLARGSARCRTEEWPPIH